MPARPRKARRFGGDAAHQRLMMANLVASLFAAEGIVTTEAKAKALRPVAEKVITKAKKGGDPDTKLHQIRQVQSYLGDREMTAKLFDDIGPRYADRNGGYTAHPQARPAPRRQRAAWRASNSSDRRRGLADSLNTSGTRQIGSRPRSEFGRRRSTSSVRGRQV